MPEIVHLKKKDLQNPGMGTKFKDENLVGYSEKKLLNFSNCKFQCTSTGSKMCYLHTLISSKMAVNLSIKGQIIIITIKPNTENNYER